MQIILDALSLVTGEVVQDQDRLLDGGALFEMPQELEEIVRVVPRQELVAGQVLHAQPDGSEDACGPALRVGDVLVRVSIDGPAFLLDHPARELGLVHEGDRSCIVLKQRGQDLGEPLSLGLQLRLPLVGPALDDVGVAIRHTVLLVELEQSGRGDLEPEVLLDLLHPLGEVVAVPVLEQLGTYELRSQVGVNL